VTEPFFEDVALQFLRVEVQRHIPRLLLDQKLSVESIAGEIVLRLTGHVLGRKLEPVEVRWPDDWWQAFRERWFPRWWLARWPVRFRVHRVEFRELYPDFKPALPQHTSRHEFRLVLNQFESSWVKTGGPKA
jgi:hypothetical protein